MANLTVDVCGEVCPMPVLRTKQALERLSPGQILEVVVDYPPSRENVQRFATSQGHRVLEVREEGERAIIVIEKA